MIPPVASEFVAGETVPEVLDHVRQLNEQGVGGIVNLLGEHYHEPDPAAEDTETYCQLVADIGRSDLDCCLSVKPSQLGLNVDDSTFRDNLTRIVATAAEAGVFVWIDMEDHHTTDVTLDAFEDLTTTHDGGVGVCVQANLKRTPADLERLAALPGKVRLVKGAYAPPRDIAYRDRERVDEAYRECLTQMFETFDDGIAVGSHDPAMLALAEDLHEDHWTPFEIQMLMGVRERAQFDLATDHAVYQYCPYGEKWLSYFYRRVRERKENLLFAARAVLS